MDRKTEELFSLNALTALTFFESVRELASPMNNAIAYAVPIITLNSGGPI